MPKQLYGKELFSIAVDSGLLLKVHEQSKAPKKRMLYFREETWPALVIKALPRASTGQISQAIQGVAKRLARTLEGLPGYGLPAISERDLELTLDLLYEELGKRL